MGSRYMLLIYLLFMIDCKYSLTVASVLIVLAVCINVAGFEASVLVLVLKVGVSVLVLRVAVLLTTLLVLIRVLVKLFLSLKRYRKVKSNAQVNKHSDPVQKMLP